jgi:hypothetical protein
MKTRLLPGIGVGILFGFVNLGCDRSLNTECCKVQTKTIAIYENQTIPANIGISTGTYTEVNGYRYVDITVEFEQKTANEEPVSLGVVFAHDASGKWGARRYFNFEQNFSAPANPQLITLTGQDSWHGPPHNKSSFITRLPIMGPFLQVFPFNHHNEARNFSIVLYLTT